MAFPAPILTENYKCSPTLHKDVDNTVKFHFRPYVCFFLPSLNGTDIHEAGDFAWKSSILDVPQLPL